MDSALCLQYDALYLPSTLCATRVSRRHTAFNPSSLSVSSNGSMHRAPPGLAFSPVISALSRCSTPSTNDKDDKKLIVRGMGGASVVLACVLGIINCNYKFTPRAIAAPRTHHIGHSSGKQDILYPKSAKDVLQSLLTVSEHVASSKGKIFPKKLKPPPEPSMKDCEDLKIKAAGLIKSGKCDEAERQLQEIYDSMRKAGKSESAYNVQMALVAVLIFQGKYREASKCDCLKEFAIPSDGRVHLYKAIIHTMLDDYKEAKECWKAFVGSVENEDTPMSKHKQQSHQIF